MRCQPRNRKYLWCAGPEQKWPVGNSGVTGIETREKPPREETMGVGGDALGM